MADTDALGRLLAAWFAIWERSFYSSAEVASMIYDNDPTARPEVATIRDALDELSPVHGDRGVSPKSLGRVLAWRCGVVVNGLVLTSVPDTHAKSRRWVVREADEADAAVPR